MDRTLRISLAFCLLLAFASTAWAQAASPSNRTDRAAVVVGTTALYGSTAGGGGGSGSGGPSSFYSIDPGTGAGTLIGAIGFNDVGAMAFHLLSHNIYAAGKRSGDGTPVLITIDPVTGAGTEVGPIGPGRGITDVAFRPSDNKLYAHRVNCPNLIYTIDVGTGSGTVVGDVLTGPCLGGNALEFSSTNTLYLAASYNGGSGPYTLFTVDQLSGAATPFVSLTYPASFGGLARANAMKFDPATGVLVCTVTTSLADDGPNFLATIDIATGVVTEIGSTVTDLDGLVFTSGLPTSATPTSWGRLKRLFR